VDESAAVCIRNSVAEIHEVGQQAQPLLESLGFSDCGGEGAATDELHGVVERAVMSMAQFINRHDGGMLKLAGNARFL